jgi:hypothetical protein
MGIHIRNFIHHQFRFYNSHGCIGKSPCRSAIKKLTPEIVMARAKICKSESWRVCVLVDDKDQILDRMTYGKAWTHMSRNIYKQITITPNKLPHVRGAQPSTYRY